MDAQRVEDVVDETEVTSRRFPSRRLPANLPPKPEGISKKQWKKQLKRERFEELRDDYLAARREKRRLARHRRRAARAEFVARGEPVPEYLKRAPRRHVAQGPSGIQLWIDCSFDDLMNEREIISTANQLVRAHSSNKRATLYTDFKVLSFNKRLKKRFETGIVDSHHENWAYFQWYDDDQLLRNFKSQSNMQDLNDDVMLDPPSLYGSRSPNSANSDDVEEPVKVNMPKNIIYLTADTDETLETLEPDTAYVIGGIVDKNRHKNLCLEKARELGIPTRRLPIGEHVQLAGRAVLTTTHVIQLMLKYLECHDWHKACSTVLPQRRLMEGDGVSNSEEEDSNQDSDFDEQ